MTADSRERTGPADVFWDRHANPKSGWTRLLSTPVIVLAIYFRKWTLLGLGVLFVAVNPILFPAREEDPDDWMTRGVRAEQFWLGEGRSVMGLGFPQVLNVLNVPVFAYGLYAAYRRRPVRAAAFTAASMALKLWFVAALIAHHERAAGEDDLAGP